MILRCIPSLLLLSTITFGQYERKGIDLDLISREAAALIQKSEPDEPKQIAKALRKLSYDDYRNIRFRPSAALWWNDPSLFRVELFHLGHLFNEQVFIYEASDTHIQEIPFLADSFNYEKSRYKPRLLAKPPGYSGLRIKYPLNRDDVFDDLIVFQGASYFRALGKGHSYGLSLRGLGMNITGDQEDFPRFTKLWLKKPKKNETVLTIYALLEGKKVTGAYEFLLQPGNTTDIDITARLYFRNQGAAEIAVAPLTSMFVFGENSNHSIRDWRPEVHDSDGLLINGDGSWTWHALENLPGRYIKSFPLQKLSGFGLIQRDREFRNYKDLEAHYEKRPSGWVTPIGKWPPGAVTLYTFASDTEATDNVTAFWSPTLSEHLDNPLEVSYRISVQTKDTSEAPARVVETRVGQRTMDSTTTTLMVEFTRPQNIAVESLEAIQIHLDPGQAVINGKPIIQHNAEEDRIRVFIDCVRQPMSPDEPYEMIAYLTHEGAMISEKWSYSWKPSH